MNNRQDRWNIILNNRQYQPFFRDRMDVWYRKDTNDIYLIRLIKESDQELTKRFIEEEKRITNIIHEKSDIEVHFLHLLTAKDGVLTKYIDYMLQTMNNLWVFSMDTGSLYIYEKQLSKFDQLECSLENDWATCKEMIPEKKHWNVSDIPWVTIALVVVNIIIYFCCVMLPRSQTAFDHIYSSFAMEWQAVLSRGQWYRLFTSMFLHFGLEHLSNNMTVLLIAGCLLEKKAGKKSFVLIYFASGMVASISSCLYHYLMQDNALCAGASGAIFGVLGAYIIVLLYSGIFKNKRMWLNLVLMLILSGVQMFLETGVDHAAHLGGLLAGILIAVIVGKETKSSQNQQM